MKKLLIIAVASVLIFAVAAPSMAMHMEVNGAARVRSWVLENYLQDGSTSEFIDQRFRLTMTWGITDSVFLKTRADVLEGFWGNSRGSFGESTSTDPVTGDTTTTTNFFQVTSKQQIAFDQVYGQFKLGDAATVVVGRQGVTWANGVAAKADNRDRLKLVYKVAPVTLVFAYDKFVESFEANLANDSIEDNHGFAAAAVYGMGDWKLGALYYYLSNKSVLGADTQAHLVSVTANGQAGPVGVKTELVYRTGDTDAGGATTDFDGLALYAGGFFNAGMANLGLEVAYARGNDPTTADNEGAASHDYDGPFWSVILFHNFDYDGFGQTTVKSADRGVSNALAVKASATANPTEKLTLIANLVWGQKDEVAAGMDDALGVEVDLIGVYNIYDNLAYTLGFGYLAAGDYFGDVDDPWGVLNRLEVKF